MSYPSLIKGGTVLDYGSIENIIDKKKLEKVSGIEFDIFGADMDKVIMYKIGF